MMSDRLVARRSDTVVEEDGVAGHTSEVDTAIALHGAEAALLGPILTVNVCPTWKPERDVYWAWNLLLPRS